MLCGAMRDLGGSKQPAPRSKLASFQELLVTLCSPCSRFGSVCVNMLRLLSLKMAASIPGSYLSESRLHTSVPPHQPLQVRAAQSSVIVSYQKVCSPCRTASI